VTAEDSSRKSLNAVDLTNKGKHDFSKLMKLENCIYLKMPRLGEWEVTEILKAALGVEEVSLNLSLQVLDLCGGSLYWCTSIAKYIKATGIENFNKEYNIDNREREEDSPTPSVFSKRLERHIVFHLEMFSVKVQTIAKYASVIGIDFHVSVLFEILPEKLRLSRHDLCKSLEKLADDGILALIQDSPTMYEFQNELIRRTLYNFVMPSDAMLIHKSVAEALEKLFSADLHSYYSSLSYHYAMSPDTERSNAFQYTMMSADQQFGNGNFVAGYLYLQYAESFVKYDTELDILSQVTDTALHDMETMSSKKRKIVPFTMEDVQNFKSLSALLASAKKSKILNNNILQRSSSLSDPKHSIDNSSSEDVKFVRKEVRRNESARAAKLLKMPSYSAKKSRKKLFVNRGCVQFNCAIS